MAALLSTVYGMLREVRWEPPVGDGGQRLAVAEARVGPLRIGDAMVFELDGEGRIARVRPHLRPLLATILFSLMIAARVARTRGLLIRALRG